MSLEEYGPFGTIVTVALALIATFSLMLLKMFGGMQKWAGIAGEEAPFVIKTGARLLAVATIAAAYLTINKSNYLWFVGAAVACGFIAVVLLARFDRLRKVHVREVPVVGGGGAEVGRKTIVIGTEATMRPADKANYEAARKRHGGLSLIDFMGGYGATNLYDPEQCWDAEVLATVRSKLTVLLIWIISLGVMTLYLAASSIEIAIRNVA